MHICHNTMIAELPTDVGILTQVWDKFGIAGVVLVALGYTSRKFFMWVTPHVEAIVEAHIANQNKMTEGTLEIQNKALEVLKSLDQKMPTVCRANCIGTPTYSLAQKS